ncbi:MAG TPA: PD-(D/E)XK nuclease family protein [Fimbriimonadaceae bacterium]|nr:PD-(D/E)XK nuclease family protein [Fimbriimonadaceae bacterium]
MARKPTLSPSKITTYLACPLRYRWTYLDEIGKWYLRSKACYSFGVTLHRVLERFHGAGEAGVPTVHEVLADYEESWVSAGFTSAEEMAEAYGEGKEILSRYVEHHQRTACDSKTLFVEKLLRRDFGEFVLIGRVDRVDEHEDGSLEIIDYKSGRELITSEDVMHDIAMACYACLLQSQFPGRVVRATMVALRSGERASYTMSPDEHEEFAFAIGELGRRILCHEWAEIVPVAKPLCRSCDFLPLCRRHHEFDLESVPAIASL